MKRKIHITITRNDRGVIHTAITPGMKLFDALECMLYGCASMVEQNTKLSKRHNLFYALVLIRDQLMKYPTNRNNAARREDGGTNGAMTVKIIDLGDRTGQMDCSSVFTGFDVVEATLGSAIHLVEKSAGVDGYNALATVKEIIVYIAHRVSLAEGIEDRCMKYFGAEAVLCDNMPNLLNDVCVVTDSEVQLYYE